MQGLFTKFGGGGAGWGGAGQRKPVKDGETPQASPGRKPFLALHSEDKGMKGYRTPESCSHRRGRSGRGCGPRN